MSTIKAANLQNTGSGAPAVKNSSGTEVGQFCKAWISFNGQNTPSIHQSFNVSSITDVSTGRFNINLTTAVSTKACVVVGVAKEGNADNGDQKICVGSHDANRMPTTSMFPLTTVSGTATLEDVGYTAAAVFSD